MGEREKELGFRQHSGAFVCVFVCLFVCVGVNVCVCVLLRGSAHEAADRDWSEQ